MDPKTRKFNEIKLIRTLKYNRNFAINFIRRNIAYLPEERIEYELDYFDHLVEIKDPEISYEKLIHGLNHLPKVKAKKIIHYEYYDSGDELFSSIKFNNENEEELIYGALDYIKCAYKTSDYKKVIDLFKKLKSVALDGSVYQEFSRKLYSREFTDLIELDILNLDRYLPLLLLSIIKEKDVDSLEMLFRLEINHDSFYLLDDDDKNVLKELLDKFFEKLPKEKVDRYQTRSYFKMSFYLKNGFLEDDELIMDE